QPGASCGVCARSRAARAAPRGAGVRFFVEAPAGVSCRARLAAYVVVRDPGGRAAVVRVRAADGTMRCWLPGGESHPRESPETTAAREVREELGRGVRLDGRIGEAGQFFYGPTEPCSYEMTAVFFRGTFQGAPLGAGTDELAWLDADRDRASFFHACHAWAASQAQ